MLGAAGLLVVFFVREEFKPSEKDKALGFFGKYKLILATRGLRRLFSLSFLHALGRSCLLPVIPLFVLHLVQVKSGVATVTGLLMGLRAIAGAVTSIWVGRLGDRIGHGRVVVVAAAALVLLYIPQMFVTATWQLVVLQTLAGIAGVGIIPGLGALISLYSPEGSSGATFGLESSVDGLARTIGPMIGASLVAFSGFSMVFMVVTGAYIGLTLVSLPLYRVVAEGGASDD